jgi:hypothetical protein
VVVPLVRKPTATAMPLSSIIGQSALLLGSLIAAYARLGVRTIEPHSVQPEPVQDLPPGTIQSQGSMSGVPLKILLSDHSGPGGLLRETLTVRPSQHE